MSAEDNQFSVRMTYDTCGEDPNDAVRTMLAAIESRSSVYVEVFDGDDYSCQEGEIGEFDLDDSAGKCQQVAKVFTYLIDREEADAVMNTNGAWHDLSEEIRSFGAYGLEQYAEQINFTLHRDHWHTLGAVTAAIAAGLERLTGRNVAAALEQLEGYGSF